MELPPPVMPASGLADWRQTDQTVDSPFSTPLVSIYTHTCVFEETVQRKQIYEQTGVDHPWKFFFTSRIRLDPPHSPSPFLTSLVRQRVATAFLDRLSRRGVTQIKKQATETVPVGDSMAHRNQYSAQLRLDSDQYREPLTVPIGSYLAVWADTDYHVAGGAYPAASPDTGPKKLVDTLQTTIDPVAAREELCELIAGCGET